MNEVEKHKITTISINKGEKLNIKIDGSVAPLTIEETEMLVDYLRTAGFIPPFYPALRNPEHRIFKSKDNNERSSLSDGFSFSTSKRYRSVFNIQVGGSLRFITLEEMGFIYETLKHFGSMCGRLFLDKEQMHIDTFEERIGLLRPGMTLEWDLTNNKEVCSKITSIAEDKKWESMEGPQRHPTIDYSITNGKILVTAKHTQFT